MYRLGTPTLLEKFIFANVYLVTSSVELRSSSAEQ